LARLAAYGCGDSETNIASDSLLGSAGRLALLEETLSVSDSLARAIRWVRAVAESSPATDSLARLAAHFATPSEVLALMDQVGEIHSAGPLPRHEFVLAGRVKTGTVPGQAKAGAVPGVVKSGSVPVH
jgi:hypothetical protein